jgi:hypothetical protein
MNDQKVTAVVERLKERCRARVRVERRTLTTYLHVIAPGDHDTYKTFVLPLIRKDFPGAHLTSGSFTPEPWASDPYMKVTISLDPKEQETMKTVYQACDGEIFGDRSEAVDYENELFDAWLDAVIEGRTQTKLSDVVCHFNDSPELSGNSEEHYGTPGDVLKSVLKTYWASL